MHPFSGDVVSEIGASTPSDSTYGADTGNAEGVLEEK